MRGFSAGSAARAGARGAAIGASLRRIAGTRRGKFGIGAAAGIGIGSMMGSRGRSSATTGLQAKSSGGQNV